MRPASLSYSFAAHGAPGRHRTASLALAVLLHLLLFLLLLRLAPPPDRSEKQFVPLVVTLSQEKSPTPTPAAAKPKAREQVPPPPRAREDRPDAEQAPVSSIWSQVIPMTREEMAAADIGRIKSSPAASVGASAGAGGSDAIAPGKGPQGQTLYHARWYREPTDAELQTYLPAGRPVQGWGIVACQTVADYRVDNCEEVAQSPAGSGLAGAVRKAAWQFRVIPPRVGGKSMVGAWVRIRITYGPEENKE